MNKHDAIIRSRVPQELKEQAVLAFDNMGLTLSEGIRLFLKNVAENEILPFEIKAPTKESQNAIDELENGRGYTSNSIDFMSALNADD